MSTRNQSKLTKLELKKQELELEKKKLQLISGLPHIYKFKHYRWSRKFYESRKRMALLLAGNQIGKSAAQIRKCINWSVSPDLWQELWPATYALDNGMKPVFWYLYPSNDFINEEWENKWSQFMPQNGYENHPQYGWDTMHKQVSSRKFIYGIRFKSGAKIYFKSYGQDSKVLQGSTLHAVFTDEELPMVHFPELMARLNDTDGYFHMVFTATDGQQTWYNAMERIGKDDEEFKHALKIRATVWDCLEYEDGSPTKWNEKRIKEKMQMYGSKQEIDRRLRARFVVSAEDGLIYDSFREDRDLITRSEMKHDKTWKIYTGVDIGSGGNNHKSAIAVVSVRPDYKYAEIIHLLRLENETTAGDVYRAYELLLRNLPSMPVGEFYDWACKDFKTISDRAGGRFQPADKSHATGIQTLNTLFGAEMLKVVNVGDAHKLTNELLNLKVKGDKRKKLDDLCDCVRYSVSSVPWDWSVLQERKKKIIPKQKTETELRKEFWNLKQAFKPEYHDYQDEINEWNELAGEFI